MKNCKCGLHEIPEWADGVNWYWGHHTQDKCTVELPNERCWCGRLRTEHQNKEGHDPDVVYENRYGQPKPNSQAFPDEPGYESGYSPPIEEMEKVMRERLYGIEVPPPTEVKPKIVNDTCMGCKAHVHSSHHTTHQCGVIPGMTASCENCRGSGIVADPLTEYATMACMRCNGGSYHIDLSRETSIYAPASKATEAWNIIAELEKLQTSHNALQALVEYIRADVCSTDKNCWCCHDMLSVANAQANNAKLLPGVDCYRCSGPPGHPDCRFCKGSGRLPEVGMNNPVPKAEE